MYDMWLGTAMYDVTRQLNSMQSPLCYLNAILYYVMPCHAMPCYTISCCTICYVMLCYTISRYAMSCCVMPCHDVSHSQILGYISNMQVLTFRVMKSSIQVWHVFGALSVCPTVVIGCRHCWPQQSRSKIKHIWISNCTIQTSWLLPPPKCTLFSCEMVQYFMLHRWKQVRFIWPGPVYNLDLSYRYSTRMLVNKIKNWISQGLFLGSD